MIKRSARWPGQTAVIQGVSWGFFIVLFLGLCFPVRLDALAEPFALIDLHVDLPYRSLYKQRPFAEGSGQYTAARLYRAGVRGVVLPLYLPEDASPLGRTRAELERSYAHVFRSIVATPPYALLGCQTSGVARPVETWLAFEDAGAVGADLAEVRKWMLRGVRSFGLVHNEPNVLATSSAQTGQLSVGLSLDGKAFVEQVFSVGGLVDVSHASDRATDDALDLAEKLGKPLIATHSNARALAPHPRNLTDQQIRRIARSGGVIGVNFHQRFLAPDGGANATLDDLVRQVKYLLTLAGPGAVAIGSDFEGGIRPVPELKDVSQVQKLAQALLAAGLSPEQVRAVFGGNARRVLCGPQASNVPAP